jgi:hypothetical protein
LNNGHTFEAALIDIVLKNGKHSGTELYDKVMAKNPHASVVMCSGYEPPAMNPRWEYVDKDHSPERFIQTVIDIWEEDSSLI